jgi:microcystin-dependent protein
MSTPYVGEIRMVGFTFAPAGWAFCNGQLMSISNNEALFTLIGTTYGGDGQTTFALPDLRGRIPVHWGTDPLSGVSYIMGQSAGTETVTLTTAQLPQHSHTVSANDGTTGTAQNSPTGAYWNKWTGSAFSTSAPNATMNAGAFPAGGAQSHDNMPPYLVINFVIAMVGVFPARG